MNLGDIKKEFFETVLEVKPTDIILREILEYKTAHPLVSMVEASKALGKYECYVGKFLNRNLDAKKRWLEIEASAKASAKASIGEKIVSLKKENPPMAMVEVSRILGKHPYFVKDFFLENPDFKKRWDEIEASAKASAKASIGEKIISLKKENPPITMVEVSRVFGGNPYFVRDFFRQNPDFKKRWDEIEKAEKDSIAEQISSPNAEQILSPKRENRPAMVIRNYIEKRHAKGINPTVKQVQSRMKGISLSCQSIIEIIEDLEFNVEYIDGKQISRSEISEY